MAYSLLGEMEVRGRDTSQWPLSFLRPFCSFQGWSSQICKLTENHKLNADV